MYVAYAISKPVTSPTFIPNSDSRDQGETQFSACTEQQKIMNSAKVLFLIAISIACSFASNKRGRRSASTSTSTSTSSSSSSSSEGSGDPGLQGLIEGFAQECVGDACVPLDGVAVEVDPPVIDAGEPAQ
ncbi:zinc finger CCHC domain-containing protein 10-like [Haliotis rufescens]|uniref:zinc finger CCHC domain-containing protein 10-like n=1 Tax=Haliotis rufescens TaxID=6454 RepID=UPI001EB08C90|nr:zinc finger CCHC domain-containing protein 10-like [Haliotis rufescens]